MKKFESERSSAKRLTGFEALYSEGKVLEVLDKDGKKKIYKEEKEGIYGDRGMAKK